MDYLETDDLVTTLQGLNYRDLEQLERAFVNPRELLAALNGYTTDAEFNTLSSSVGSLSTNFDALSEKVGNIPVTSDVLWAQSGSNPSKHISRRY